MATKAELEEQARAYGIDPNGLTKAELEEALSAAGYSEGGGQGMDGQSEPYYPQQRRHAALEG